MLYTKICVFYIANKMNIINDDIRIYPLNVTTLEEDYFRREQQSCEPLLGGFVGMPPKKIFTNSAISCVLRAIFNHFHGTKSSQKIINKHEFFH